MRKWRGIEKHVFVYVCVLAKGRRWDKNSNSKVFSLISDSKWVFRGMWWKLNPLNLNFTVVFILFN